MAEERANQPPPATVVRHERALDELLWRIYVWLVNPTAVITTMPPRDKEV